MYDKPGDAEKWAATSGSVLIISYTKLSTALGVKSVKSLKVSAAGW